MVAKQFSTTTAKPSLQVTTTTSFQVPPRNARIPTPARGQESFRGPPQAGRRPSQPHAAIPGAARLDQILKPGDVICVQGREGGAMMQLGATGGYMGHVLLVLGHPRCVMKNTAEGHPYTHMWPTDYECQTMWIVSTMESTRNAEGFHESDYLLFIDDHSGRIFAVGEERRHALLKFDSPEPVECWQSPADLRIGFRLDIMTEVLNEMRQSEENWSWATAVRAFLFSAKVSENRRGTLRQIQQCWHADPICSSLVVVFWQRYLCALADFYNNTPSPHATQVDALDYIMSWMPLKSDRALPGELLSTMKQCGWTPVSRVQPAGRSRGYTA